METAIAFGAEFPVIGRATVRGTSKHGRNRVAEHGTEWLILDHTVNTQNVHGTLLRSQATDHARWLRTADLEIISMISEPTARMKS